MDSEYLNSQAKKAQMEKLAVNDENELNSLLAYYRERLNDNDKEQTEWIEKICKLQYEIQDHHKKELELQKENQEILDLQKTISELKVSQFEEKQQRLQLQRELDQLKQTSNEDNKKIQYLQSLCDPAQESVVVQKDLRPIINHKKISNDLNIVGNSKQCSGKIGGSSQNSSTQCQGRALVKTIYLPNEKMNDLVTENQQLKINCQQYQDLFQLELSALKDQLKIRDEESKLRQANNNDLIQQLKKKKEKLERMMGAISKEYFAQRLHYNQLETQAQEERESLRQRHEQLQKKLADVQKCTSIENQVSKELKDKLNEEYVDKFRNQISNKDETLAIIKNQFAQAQKIYLKNINELQETLAKLAEKYNKLEQKRRQEITQCQHENRSLKQQLEQINQQLPELEEGSEQEIQGSATKKFAQNESASKKKKTQKKNLQGLKKKTQKTMKRQIKGKENKADLENQQADEDNNEEGDESESMRSQDIENINQQLIELEKQMDIAKQH